MIRLAARNISKNYGGVAALKGVDFDIHAGAVNVLIGENGAGKSTLMRIVAGVERPDSGKLILDGKAVDLTSVEDAALRGISIVHQELSLCPNLTVSENIFLVHGTRQAMTLDRKLERSRAREVLHRLGTTIDPDVLVSELSVGEQQIVEIARAISRDTSVLILDEPTSALSATEIKKLFQVIEELRSADVAIVYISHRMQEIEQIGDYVTVLRDGERVAASDYKAFSIPWIVNRMLVAESRPAKRAVPASGPKILEIDHLTVWRTNSSIAVDDLSLEIRSGEITCLYGLLGAGRTELFEALCGARRSEGSVSLNGQPIESLPLHKRLSVGLQLVPEDRKSEGIFSNLAVAQNLSVSFLDRLNISGWVSAKRENSRAEDMMRKMGIKAHSISAGIATLSGGNQQKVLIGRSLMPEPRVLLLDEPGRGVDVGARAEIFKSIRELADAGVAVVYSTCDLPDALAAADRIIVMANGRITADTPVGMATEEKLVRAASATLPSHQSTEAS